MTKIKYHRYRPRPLENQDVYAAKIPEVEGVESMLIEGIEVRPGGYLVKNENGDAGFVEGDDFESRYARIRSRRTSQASDGQTSEEGT